jgi:hypothetical protein
MSSPSLHSLDRLAAGLRSEGLAYDNLEPLTRPPDVCRDTSERIASGDSSMLSHHALFCALSRYGVIWEDRFYLLIVYHSLHRYRPALWQDSVCAGCARLQASARSSHPGADTAAGRCFNHPVTHPSD